MARFFAVENRLINLDQVQEITYDGGSDNDRAAVLLIRFGVYQAEDGGFHPDQAIIRGPEAAEVWGRLKSM